MPVKSEERPRTLSQFKRILTQDGEREKVISWNPRRYGYDRNTYAAVVVLTKDGKKEIYPARNADEAQRIYEVL